MFKFKGIGAAAPAFALLVALGTHGVRAQESAQDSMAAAADPSAVVATVGDAKITERDVTLARSYLESELSRVPEDKKKAFLIDALVTMQLLGQAAHDEGLDQTDAFAEQMAFLKLQAQRNAYVRDKVIGAISDEEMQDAYQKMVVEPFKPQEQLHARHILLEKKEDAEKVIADLNNGASFEELAKERSKGPTGPNGGDLGFFGKGQMVKEFEDAAFALEPGETSKEPVQSKFGWHVIKVEEKRMSTPPAFDDVKAQINELLVRQRFGSVIAGLHEKYKVEIVGQADAASPDAMKPDAMNPDAKN